MTVNFTYRFLALLCFAVAAFDIFAGERDSAAPNFFLELENPSAEEVDGRGRPVGWGYYHGSGKSEWGTTNNAPDGERCVYVRNLAHGAESHSVNAAAVLGRSRGYTGERAYPALPDREYHVSFWARTEPAEYMRWDLLGTRRHFVTFRAVGWRSEEAHSRDRGFFGIQLDEIVDEKGEWKKYAGRFRTCPDTRKFVLTFRIGGRAANYTDLGTLFVDGVDVYPVFRLGVYRGGTTFGYEPIMDAARTIRGVRPEYFTEITIDNLLNYDAVIFPNVHGFGMDIKPFWKEAVRQYVERCGGSVVFYHDSVGYIRSPFGEESLFPEVAAAPYGTDSNWPDPYEMIVADPDHIITGQWEEEERVPIMYVDFRTMTPGPDGRVLARAPRGGASLVVGEVGRGRVVFNGSIIHSQAGELFESDWAPAGDVEAVGADRDMLLNTIKWFMSESSGVDAEAAEEATARFRAMEREEFGEPVVILPEPLELSVEEGKTLVSSGAEARAIVVIGDDADPRIMAGANDLREDVRRLGGELVVKEASELSEDDLAEYNLIVLGSAEADNRLAQRYAEAHSGLFSGRFAVTSDNPGPEGYVIRSFRNEQGRDVLMGMGSDAQGTMYAAFSIRWLFEEDGGEITARRASVRDRPDIAVRATRIALWVYSRTPSAHRVDFENAKHIIDWYSRYKVNRIYTRYSHPFATMDEEDRERDLAVIERIVDYAGTRGVGIGLSSYSDVNNPHTGDCYRLCPSDADAVARRRIEYEYIRDRIKPEEMWLHTRDGSARAVQESFEQRCDKCRERFDTRAQYNAAEVNLAVDVFGSAVTVGICSTPYSINPDGLGFEREREYLKAMAELTPEVPLQVVRESANLEAYNRLTNKRIHLYQAPYSHFDSNNYTDEIVAVVEYRSHYPFRHPGVLVLWRAGSSALIPDEHMMALCRELYGKGAAEHLSKVVVPAFRTNFRRFWTRETKPIAAQTRFDPEILDELIAERREALRNLELAAEHPGGFNPEWTEEHIARFSTHVKMQLDWYEICRSKQQGREEEFSENLAAFKSFLEDENPPYWRDFMRTINDVWET